MLGQVVHPVLLPSAALSHFPIGQFSKHHAFRRPRDPRPGDGSDKQASKQTNKTLRFFMVLSTPSHPFCLRAAQYGSLWSVFFFFQKPMTRSNRSCWMVHSLALCFRRGIHATRPYSKKGLHYTSAECACIITPLAYFLFGPEVTEGNSSPAPTQMLALDFYRALDPAVPSLVDLHRIVRSHPVRAFRALFSRHSPQYSRGDERRDLRRKKTATPGIELRLTAVGFQGLTTTLRTDHIYIYADLELEGRVPSATE